MVIHLWRHLQPPCKALSCLRSRNWVEESSVFVAISFLYLSWSFPPRNIPLTKKNECLPPGPGLPLWASSAPLSTRVAGTIPQAHHPVGAAQGREGGAGPIDSQLGQAQAASRSAQRLRQPTTPKPGAARSSCQGPALQTLSREYPADPQAAAPHAPMHHRPMRPLGPRPNTRESSLKSISPMFGSVTQEGAMASVSQGCESCSCLPVDGTLLLRISSARHKAGILRASPGLHDVGYYGPGEFG